MAGPAPTLWAATCPEPPPLASPLDGDASVDVAIVGAGYTGLWTALSLLAAEPSTRVIVVDRRSVGFGASGRNGGWCSALLPVSLTALERRHGRSAAIAWQRAMFETIDVVGRFADVSATGGHDPQFAKGGTIAVARNERQHGRLSAALAEARRFGFGEADMRLLDDEGTAEHVRGAGVTSALFSPHCAAVHPLRLVGAIASAAAAAGARVVENVDVVDIESHRLTTTAGTIRADVVVLATEAYTTQLPRRRRDVLPIYSLMVGSEPLAETTWKAIGLDARETFSIASNVVVYGQRTADDRLAFGGRGAPYHFASRIDDRFDVDETVRRQLVELLTELFPDLADVDFPYHWGGPLAAPRDWHPHVRFDRRTGLASAGGYVGDGVATANLAGRTLADLVHGRSTELTSLPWVGHRSRRWEPEPLRWAGVHLVARAAAAADRAEALPGSSAAWRGRAWSRLLESLAGR